MGIKNKDVNQGKSCSRPPRRLFDESVFTKVKEVFERSWERGRDFGFQDEFEDEYCDAFVKFQGGEGYADAVSSGTSAIFLALSALDLPENAAVISSPVTNVGAITPLVLLNLRPVLADSEPDSYNIGPEQFEAVLTADVKAAVITHVGGIPARIEELVEIARSRGVKVIEDCSHAHGAEINGRKVGTFGDIAIFSTMFSKNHSTGGCGGVIYTRNEDFFWKTRSLADRGKPFQQADFNQQHVSEYLFPALNFNQDELSCAIGTATLAKLPDIIRKRNSIMRRIYKRLEETKSMRPLEIATNLTPSPFFCTVKVKKELLKVDKRDFGMALIDEGVWLNPDYHEVVAEWTWMERLLKEKPCTPNASKFRSDTFNLLFHENFTETEIDETIKAILKMEGEYLK